MPSAEIEEERKGMQGVYMPWVGIDLLNRCQRKIHLEENI